MNLEVKLELEGEAPNKPKKNFLFYPRTCFSLELPVYPFVPALSNVRALTLKRRVFPS